MGVEELKELGSLVESRGNSAVISVSKAGPEFKKFTLVFRQAFGSNTFIPHNHSINQSINR